MIVLIGGLFLPTEQVAKMLAIAPNPATREELQESFGLKDREHFRKAYLEPLVSAGWLERTIPDKPTSRFQRYRITEKGRKWLKNREDGVRLCFLLLAYDCKKQGMTPSACPLPLQKIP